MKIANFLACILAISIIGATVDYAIRPYVGIETAKLAGYLVDFAGALWATNKFLL